MGCGAAATSLADLYSIEWDIVRATLLETLPVAVVFAWLQRYLVRGLALAAVK